ncbi:methylenetetrahydrofolate reductase [Demequina gelatinilytica]|uniref:methylenetetrahydrofolate reductase n=1 Tax=Demequina gelatinilytica TaxID=1638980 RepID=UPI0007809FEF|nr:methylenetetrahydrofolate reductase [Demequina gelatinilytica]
MHRTTALLHDLSVEVTARDRAAIARAGLAAGTRVSITHLGTETMQDRLDAAAAVRAAGLVPVPHVSARRLDDEQALRGALTGLREHGAHERVFVVGGDPRTPAGPYGSALDVIRSGLLAEHGVREVGLAGYPEGHPAIGDAELWESLAAKVAAVEEQGMTATVTSQFSFDADAVVAWITRVREAGVTAPVRVGVPGPAGIGRLLAFARRCGVGSSAGIVRKYGFSLTNLMGTATPDRFVADLAGRLDLAHHGEVHLHVYAFGDVAATAGWIAAAATRTLPIDAAEPA